MGRESRRIKKNMAKQQPSQPQVKLDINDMEDIVCNKCGNYTFELVYLFKRVSPIVSPTGEESAFPIETFACNACGHVNEKFLPRQQKVEKSEEVDKVESTIIT